jgi:stage II sporulation protein P
MVYFANRLTVSDLQFYVNSSGGFDFMYRKRWGSRSSRGLTPGKIALLALTFWVVSGLVMVAFISSNTKDVAEGSEGIGKMYIGNIFPTISRGAKYESRAAGSMALRTGESGIGTDDVNLNGTDLENKKDSSNIFKSMLGNMFPVAQVLDDDLAEEDPGINFAEQDTINKDGKEGILPENSIVQTTPRPPSANIDFTKPVVIIYHTHATESYQPVSEGNFHTLEEYGTVREVGNVMAAELEAKGIQVIHDKTIHDYPSYSKSYSRSLETVKTLMGNNESTKIIIDLHRDAAAYTGNNPKVVKINNEDVAQYSLVVGTGNPNVEALRTFAGYINSKAEEMYPGLAGRIIEKEYKFNQHVSDYHLLLEAGNNENTIDQAKRLGKCFANVLAEAIKEIQ